MYLYWFCLGCFFMKIEFLDSIERIDKEEWDKAINNQYPFLKYEFLKALEITKCVSPEEGWTPLHLVVSEMDMILAVMPLYIKTDSQGEFIFDWSWADAYYRNGLDYYPKLVCSIPFTPASGPRVVITDSTRTEEIIKVVSSALKQLSEENNFSSVHILLADKDEINLYSDQDFSLRTSYSFHWFNKEYKNFGNFLEDMTSRQRKNIKKERSKICSQGIVMSKIKGSEITDEMLESFYKFYQVTYLKRGMRGYLNLDFFKEIVKKMPESILMVLAQNSSREYVAGALNFYDEEKLYGRYWGCLEEYDSLHFETCYYQGIEFCIEEKLDSFDPGVQGEHKIKRGFCPIETFSAHWIKDIRFKEAIDDFLSRERAHILEYNQDRKSRLPFRKEVISDLYEKI
jgi:predicted N-acyltransferase